MLLQLAWKTNVQRLRMWKVNERRQHARLCDRDVSVSWAGSLQTKPKSSYKNNDETLRGKSENCEGEKVNNVLTSAQILKLKQDQGSIHALLIKPLIHPQKTNVNRVRYQDHKDLRRKLFFVVHWSSYAKCIRSKGLTRRLYPRSSSVSLKQKRKTTSKLARKRAETYVWVHKELQTQQQKWSKFLFLMHISIIAQVTKAIVSKGETGKKKTNKHNRHSYTFYCDLN